MKMKISKQAILKAPAGHQTRISGCGVHRNRKADKKLRRLGDKVKVIE